MAKYSVNGTEIIDDNGKLVFSRVTGTPTWITSPTGRRVIGTGTANFQGVEMTGTSIRAISFS